MTWNFTYIICAAIGSLILWAKLGEKQKLTVYGLGKLWNLLGIAGRKRDVVELLCFIFMGVFVGMLFTEPSNVRQAFSAGLGWTGLLTTSRR